MEELGKRHKENYFMNYCYAVLGMRNQDINCLYKSRVDKNWVPNENTIIFNPRAKRPKMTMHVVDYKTAQVYGPKKLELTDARLFEELCAMQLKHNDYIFATRSGGKPTLNHMNVKAMQMSLFGLGEGRIAKVLIKHCIDSGDHTRVSEISKARGTAMQTLYSHYNTYDQS